MRPGSYMLSAITGLTPGGNYRLHAINRDETEKYLVIYADSTLRTFELDGTEADVLGLESGSDPKAYLDSGDATADQLRLVTIADYTLLANITVETASKTSERYTVEDEHTDYDVMTSWTPTIDTYHRTSEDTPSHAAGYFKYEPGVGTFATWTSEELGTGWDAVVDGWDTEANNPAGIKIAFQRLPMVIAGGTWDASALTLTKTDAFADYTWAEGDQIYVSGGTAVTTGWYDIASRTDDDTIVLTADITTNASDPADVTTTAIGGEFVPHWDFYTNTPTDMEEVAQRVQQALRDSGATDACVAYDTVTAAHRGQLIITAPWRGEDTKVLSIGDPVDYDDFSSDGRPFHYAHGTATDGVGDPETDTLDVLDRWTQVAAPMQREAALDETTMPIKITREHSGGRYGSDYSEIIIEDAPVSYWRLGEPSGTDAADEMKRNHGTYTNTPTLAQASLLPGETDTSVAFARSSSEYVDCQTMGNLGSQLTNGLTIEAWIKSTDTGIWATIAGGSGTASGQQWTYLAFDNNNRINFVVDPPAYNKALWAISVVQTAVLDGNEHHIVGTFDGNDEFHLFVDGLEVTSTTYDLTNGRRDYADFNKDFTIGARGPVGAGAPTDYWLGTLDEVAVYNKALTPLQVLLHYYAGKASNYDGPAVFVADTIDWKPRYTGDKETNPLPLLIEDGTKIRDVAFHRNRLVLAGGERTEMSQSGDFFNFFIKTFDNIVDSDPISAPLSSDQVTLVDYVLPFRKALLIFTQASRQFELNAPEVLTAGTAAITASTSNLSLPGVQPTVMGTMCYFASKDASGGQLMEYFYNDSEAANAAADVSSHCPGYLPDNIRTLDSCPNYATVLCLSGDKNAIYTYRSHWSGNEKAQSAWARTTFPSAHTIHDIAVIDTDAYLLIEDANGFFLARMPIPSDDDVDFGETLHLDDRVEIASGTYNGSTETTWTTTVHDIAIDTVVLGNGWGDDAGTVYAATCNGNTITVTDTTDLSANNIYAGAAVGMVLTLSRPYVRSRDDSAVLDGSLVLHKLVLNHYNSGDYKVTVAQPNRADVVHTQTFSGLTDAEGSSQFFITALSNNCTVSISNSGPLPVGIAVAEWITTFTPRSM